MTIRIVIIPDTQMPFDDRRALRSVIRFIGQFQPDEVIHIGDVMDYPMPSQWSKGTAEEFAKLMLKHNADAVRRLIEPLREVYDGPVGFHEGNHDLRPRKYLEKYAPALSEFEGAFHISSLLQFEEWGISLLPDFYDAAPGWVTTHGHLGKLSLSQNAGSTAALGAVKMRSSVAIGHTHRLGLVPRSFGRDGKVSETLWGMEVGHLMDMKKAQYLNGGTGNWQQGFGMLTITGKHVKPELVPIERNRFVVDGHAWEVK